MLEIRIQETACANGFKNHNFIPRVWPIALNTTISPAQPSVASDGLLTAKEKEATPRKLNPFTPKIR